MFVRVLRSHVMVRVGGGWETLSAYFSKMDPCRAPMGGSHSLILYSSADYSFSRLKFIRGFIMSRTYYILRYSLHHDSSDFVGYIFTQRNQ